MPVVVMIAYLDKRSIHARLSSHEPTIGFARGGEFLVEFLDTASEVEHELLLVSSSSWSAAVAMGAPNPLRSNACWPSISESLSSRSPTRWARRRFSAWRFAFSVSTERWLMVVAAGDGFSIASAACRSAWFVSHACAEPAQLRQQGTTTSAVAFPGYVGRLVETFAGTA
jgi:hypothetical protein